MQKDTLKNSYRFLDIIILSYLIFDFGFALNDHFKPYKLLGFYSITSLLLVFNILKYYQFKTENTRKIIRFNAFILLSILITATVIIGINWEASIITHTRHTRIVFEVGLFFYLLLRLSFLIKHIYKIYFNPAILFVGSFGLFSLIGAFFLMLPRMTTHGINFIDALFTSTSAICVTGLTVLSTANDFTQLGQLVILILIQIGGLGILTFTSFFAYFFKENSSFSEGLYLKDFTASEHLHDVFSLVIKIVAFTLFLEGLGAVLIFTSLEPTNLLADRVFFSVFHAISAFCNAGFSTATDNILSEGLRFNYGFQWILMTLIIFGGLGYNIVFNIVTYYKNRFVNLLFKKPKYQLVRIITLNSKIILVTTALLLIFGFGILYLFEAQFTLRDHTSTFGKITTAMFHAVTPRTAGFNTVDYTQVAIPSLLIIILLMWVGASPASTGGGIKTSTFAVASLNILAMARGQKHIEINGRQISNSTVHRAFAIISLSLIVIGIGALCLAYFEPGKDILAIVFECFSAYSTVGLSMNLTPSLSEPSKLVIIMLMFLGRIGTLNLLFGMLRRLETPFYQYPEEQILIN